ncbi:AraC family transcriptional regulator [Myroides odoratimimus]|uniref:AraC family transcriptional regulator n=1 Tax=Myroides odoratimimus TaxID=76832 RepID=UPI002575A262|nr:helix-turn-helix domain-containing protein [Myroides odoratimimus]MDM1499699.1 AraC family transcriptional regulator [Myroides odoratimimus]
MKFLSNPYNAKSDKAIFEKIVQLTIVLVALQFLLSLININITFGYFILPIIYVMIKYDRTEVNIFTKLQLHFVGTLGVLLLAFSEMTMLYEIVNLLFLAGYLFAICKNINSVHAKNLSYKAFNFISFFSFYAVAGTVICFFYFLMDLFDKSYGVTSSFLFGGIDFFAILFSTLTLIVSRSEETVENEIKEVTNKIIDAPVLNVVVTDALEKEMSGQVESIIQYFENSEEYLDTNFSLDHLAKEVEMSKHHLSEVINHDMNTSFYQLLAKYRINHAKFLIEKKQNLTIEAIVDECGFSSKSTFNKYFKYFVGQTPSGYRSLVA